ncbi:hypothetical protein KPH14_000996 [Odynerus spinipes]|uniref:Phorbol-ester/DAG-type domain-containing protein n=1 Tax=Odynerus spinipes TaxID=1348599 RepID=A0AAD9RFK2_9HYME|nr:hypothetical protein KPH14_000996 [Odynerus spinipes]
MPSSENKLCRGCQKPVVKAVSCDKCCLHYHPSCASKANLTGLDDELTCCNTINTTSVVSQEPVPTSTIQLWFRSEFDKFKSEFKAELANMYQDQFKAINDELSNLTSRLNLIESKINDDCILNSCRLDTTLDSPEQLPTGIETIMSELTDRERR